MADRYAPIGVFDSGVGGLTVAREIMRQLPNESIEYFGDTARVPYGTKSRATVTRYSKQIIRFLQTKNVKAIVVACNTASAYALEEIEPQLDIPIIGVVKPGAVEAAATTQNNKIGVIGTQATIGSGIYTQTIHKIRDDIEVMGKACPLLVSLVEEGWLHDRITDQVIIRYLAPFFDAGVDTLIMGCTHYPLLRTAFRKILGDEVKLVNPAYETAKELGILLNKLNLNNDGALSDKKPTYEYYVSDAASRFMDFADSILPFDVRNVSIVPIEDY